MENNQKLITEIRCKFSNHGFDFTNKDILSLGEENILNIKNHMETSFFDLFLKIYKTKEELMEFFKKKKKDNPGQVVNIRPIKFDSKVPVCKNCGNFDQSAIETGKCSNCDCDYFVEED